MAFVAPAVAVDAATRRMLEGKGPLTKKDVHRLNQIAATQKQRKRVGTVKVVA